MIDWKWIGGIAATVIVGVLSSRHIKLKKRSKRGKQSEEKPEVMIPQTSETWKKSNLIEAKEILGEFRPYYKYYYKRSEDEQIRYALREGKNVLILGAPLSGKTRAAYEALVNMEQAHDVWIPECKDIDPEKFRIPQRVASSVAPQLVFLDDLQRFAAQKNIEVLLREITKQKFLVFATCRSEKEFTEACEKLSTKNIYVESIFSNVIEMGKVSPETAKEAAEEVEIPWEEVEFDGNIGSVFLPLSEMRKRYTKCGSEEKTILGAVSTLYRFGVYFGPQFFPIDWIKRVANIKGLEGKDYEWDGWLGTLKDSEFISTFKDFAHSEEVYLEKIVSPLYAETDIGFYNRLIEIFKDVPDALVMIGDKAYEVGKDNVEIVQFMHVAIKAYQGALKHWTKEKYPMGYAYTNNALGVSYCRVAEAEEKTQNCLNAIDAHKKALEVYTFDRLPEEYAMTQNNLGNAYQRLAEAVGKVENCQLAIGAYAEALRVYTVDRFPIQYATIQNNLGDTYRVLAEMEEKSENCKNAIKACKKALKVRTVDRFPIQYAATQNNLGNAYCTLAEVEGKVENCRSAIVAYREALMVRTFDRYPMRYATTLNNLGNAYGILADVEGKAENCRLAIGAYQEALEVRNVDRFPFQYALTQNNLGNTYRKLAEVEEKPENCEEAVVAYMKALKIYTKKDFPEVFPGVMGNLARAVHFCKDVLPKEIRKMLDDE